MIIGQKSLGSLGYGGESQWISFSTISSISITATKNLTLSFYLAEDKSNSPLTALGIPPEISPF
jgi:hypothetical protein